MNNKKSILILIMTTLTFILMLGVLVFFIRIIRNKNTHTSVVMSTLESRMIEKENFSIMEEKVKETEVTHNKINNYFINKNKADLFVDYLENLGASSNTKLTVKNVESSLSDKSTINFKVSIRGSFNAVMKTISILENTPYNLFINSLYLNEETVQTEADSKNSKIINNKLWVAEVSFGILVLE